mgnify:CR=1 FL=1
MTTIQRLGTLAAVGFAATLLHASPEYTFKIAFKNGAQQEFATSDISKITFGSEVEEAKSENVSLNKIAPSSTAKEEKKTPGIKFRSVNWDSKHKKLKVILDKPVIFFHIRNGFQCFKTPRFTQTVVPFQQFTVIVAVLALS